ncbi:DUF938 domain-containing protein [Aestuariivita boseongensis]|uniref:DUF938 domain-containing protein n=1 Tax=Aestuariivita boseongensis TaxID=1470562 RepID=UPI000681A178|nr:DUF938 domain-containing protein [Aestuariivita boseongensis]
MTGRSLPPTASVAHAQAGDKLRAPAAERNATAIATLIARIAPAEGLALELASGTGQHVVAFAQAAPQLTWQPTELAPDRLKSIAAHMAEASCDNILPPLRLHATQSGWAADHRADLIVLINLTHLISDAETRSLFAEVAQALRPGGQFLLYGPFMRDGQLISNGDRTFHNSLISSDPMIGYKNDADIRTWMEDAGLRNAEPVEMPANNLAMIARAG